MKFSQVIAILVLLGAIIGVLFVYYQTDLVNLNSKSNANNNSNGLKESTYSIEITQAYFCCGSESPDLTLRILNNGTDNISISSITVGSDLSNYNIRSSFPVKIVSGSSFEFSITPRSGSYVIDVNSDILLIINYTGGNQLQLTTEDFRFG